MRAARPDIIATRHAISAGHYLATRAGDEILRAGGNAIDAGVAAGITLGVVQGDLVNVAGVAPLMVYHAESQTLVNLDGLGVWPRAADIDHLIDEHGGAIPIGLLRCVVPAAPSAWLTALGRFGTMSFADVVAPAIDLARHGFAVDQWMAEFIAASEEGYRRWPQNAAIYLPHDRPPREGEILVQSDLADSLQYLADEERAHAGAGRVAGLDAAHDAFYRGDIAARIADYHAEHGGWMTREDLAEFRAREEPTVSATFAGLEVHCCGPWSQGPALAQALALLDTRALAAAGHNSVGALHTTVEALKLAFADRERWVGDADFVDVPLAGLLDPAYLAERRALIRPDRAWPEMPPAGMPPGAPVTDAAGAVGAGVGDAAALSGADTSYVCVMDQWGNAFSATPSDVSSSVPVIPGTGLAPSGRGSQGRAERGHPASVAPGKRPRLTPNPAMAFENGRPKLLFGTPGGDVQIQAMVQFLANRRVFGLGLQEAIEAPRVASYSFPSSFAPNPCEPGRLAAEGRLDEAVTDGLAALGHGVERWPDWSRLAGAMCAIEADGDTLRAGADPRRAAYALGR